MSSTTSEQDNDRMETDLNPYQSSPENPWPETEYTEEEQIQCVPGERVSRVLHLFEIRRNGTRVPLPIGQPQSAYKDITAIGIAGTLTGKAGLFAQCCWFGNYDLDWFWCRITDIEVVEVKCDISDRCAWLSSAHGDYALLVPNPAYADMWEESLHVHGPAARDAQVVVWPTQGTRPDWWDPHWKGAWPWDKDPEAMDIDEDNRANERWLRLGPHGDQRFPGEPLSHLHTLLPWVISPSGLTLTERE